MGYCAECEKYAALNVIYRCADCMKIWAARWMADRKAEF